MAVYVGDEQEFSASSSLMNGRRLELSFPVCDYKEGLISEDTTLFQCKTGMRGQYVSGSESAPPIIINIIK